MLNPKSIQGKTHIEQMEENYSKIPIYSDEWTNFNPSDPGITILENLTAFQTLQQNQMDEVPEQVKAKLLELLGYTPQKGHGASVYLEPKGAKEPFLIPADQRFSVGKIAFETTLARAMTASHITAVVGKDENGIHNYSYILGDDITVSAPVFGKKTREGRQLYFILDRPLEADETGIIYVDIDNRYHRNPFDGDCENIGGMLEWECYTKDGFAKMKVLDTTNGFLSSGTVTFSQEERDMAPLEGKEWSGYAIRVTLKKDCYDIAPLVRHISGFLFPVVQKETMVIAYTFQKSTEVAMYSALLEEGYIQVFAKEKKGTSYRKYLESYSDEDRGRYYRKVRHGFGQYTFEFDKQLYGYGPENGTKNTVKVVIYNEEMMRKYYLGEVFGYDDQEIKLPRGHVMTETFCVIAERTLDDGSKIYDFLKPGRMGEKELSYYLYENEGKLLILDAGDYVGAKLYIGSIAVTMGETGNVRAGNRFIPQNYEDGIRFYNPAQGEGGRFQETLEDVRRRFVRDVYETKTAIMAKDYETLVYHTPGLCISKVHAWMDQDKNEVQIAVMPGIPETFPKLPEVYRKEIEKRIEKHRLLSTCVKIRQPVYTPVLTSGIIYVKPHYERCREQIETVIRRELDYINGAKGFGEWFRFDKLFRAVEELDCVAYIYELGIMPFNQQNAVMDGADIKPAENCLLYPGQMKLEILPSPKEHE